MAKGAEEAELTDWQKEQAAEKEARCFATSTKSKSNGATYPCLLVSLQAQTRSFSVLQELLRALAVA